MPDAGGAYLLPRIVGLPRAKEILFLGGDLSAADAERFGIANRVVPADEVLDTAGEYTSRLAGLPTRALAMTKWLVNRSFESSRHTAFEEKAYAQELVQRTEDAQEGVAACRERRQPEFPGAGSRDPARVPGRPAPVRSRPSPTARASPRAQSTWSATTSSPPSSVGVAEDHRQQVDATVAAGVLASLVESDDVDPRELELLPGRPLHEQEPVGG
ncbi:MAG: enoyl-CoA hydratase-related protein [Acidimicrobiia bacterium]|nr:enoyl-CoA hydratase-related protein [Acidimicrobiia bacterium]